jgi:hypothetical protein
MDLVSLLCYDIPKLRTAPYFMKERRKILWRIDTLLSSDYVNNDRFWATARYAHNTRITVGNGVFSMRSVLRCHKQGAKSVVSSTWEAVEMEPVRVKLKNLYC